MKEPLIRFEKVEKRFGDLAVLDGLDFFVNKGEVTTVIGKSGVGKSVLLKHIAGLIAPDRGEIYFEGKPMSAMKRADRRKMRRKFSYMFQGTALFDSMTVYENIALPLSERTRLSADEIRKKVTAKLRQLDIEGIGAKYPSQISGGMKKRVALARALVTEPEIVLFDEPTTGLDPVRKNAVHAMISDYQQRFGFTALVVSHEIPDVFYISQRIAMIDRGKIIFEGTPAQLQQETDPRVAQFVRGLETRHDAMTGIVPQTQGEKRFNEAMAHLKRHKVDFSLILFTVRNLAEVNEQMGHDKGQAILQEFASHVHRRLRITDTCSRYGMDKIMVVLPNTNREQAERVCAKLARELKEAASGVREKPGGVCFTVTAGFVEADEQSRFDQVLENAEQNQSILSEFQVC